MEGKWQQTQPTVSQDYKYNNKEQNSEYGLEWMDFGNRWMMTWVPQFSGVDPISEKFPHVSTYNYAENSPIANIDLWGLQKFSIHSSSFAPFNTFGGPFKGDGTNREFGTNPDASARISGRIDIDASSSNIALVNNIANGSESHNTLTGNSAFSKAEMVSNISESRVKNNNMAAEVDFHLSGNNALVPGSPDIDAKGSIGIARKDLKQNGSIVGIAGEITGDKFPANETFITDQNGVGVMLGVSGADGNPFTSLAGNNNRKMSSFVLAIHFDKKGNITGVSDSKRQYSVKEWNKQFTNLKPQDGNVSTNTTNH